MKPLVARDTELLVIAGIGNSRSAYILDVEPYLSGVKANQFLRRVNPEQIDVRLNEPIPVFQVVSGSEVRYDMTDMENLVKSHAFVVTLNLILLDHIPE